MKRNILSALILLIALSLSAQKSLEGLWVGTVTGGIHSETGYKFEMIIEVEGGTIKGKSYVHLGPDEVIEMELRGRMYQDRSIYMQDIEFVATEGKEILPQFYRKYQFAYSRSIWESSLEGYWQEIREDAFHPNRKRGRIILKKVGKDKA